MSDDIHDDGRTFEYFKYDDSSTSSKLVAAADGSHRRTQVEVKNVVTVNSNDGGLSHMFPSIPYRMTQNWPAESEPPSYATGATLYAEVFTEYIPGRDIGWHTAYHALSDNGESTGTLTLSWPKNTLGPRPYEIYITYNASAAPIPEPETYALLVAGLALMGRMVRRRAQQL